MRFNLQEAQSFYIENLINKSFVFKTQKGLFVFRFDETNFCHLLGLHYFNPSWKGATGWEMIKDEEITHIAIKRIDKINYASIYKPRINVLYNLKDILAICKYIRKYNRIGNRKFECDLVLNNEKEKNYQVVSFFLDKKTFEYFAGASLLEFSKKDKNVIAYINPNDYLEIEERYIDNTNQTINNIDNDFLMTLH